MEVAGILPQQEAQGQSAEGPGLLVAPQRQQASEGQAAGAGGSPSDFVLQTMLVPGEVLPTAFEASEKWPNLIHQPLDQGNCAGSWAFSTAGTCEGRAGSAGKGAEA